MPACHTLLYTPTCQNATQGVLRILSWSNHTAKTFIWPTLLFAAITLVIFRNYLTGAFFVGTDAMGPPTDLSVMFLENSYFSAWRDMPSLGHIEFPSPILSSVYYVLMSILHMTPDDVFRLFIIFSFWLAGFAMYLCAYRLTSSRVSALAAGIIYLFSQVYLSQITENHHLFISGYAVFPLLFLCLYLTISERKKIYAVLLPILSLILGTVGAPHTILISAIFLLLFIFSYSFLICLRKQYAAALSTFFIGLVSAAVLVIPMALSKFADGGMFTLSTAYTIEDAEIFSSYSLLHSIVMFASENTFINTVSGSWTLVTELWPLSYLTALTIPLAAFYALKIRAERRLLISLAVPAVAFIFIACGPHPPLGFIFEFLFNNLPLMDSIRVYSRFHLLTGFAYALMIAFLLSHINEIRNMPTRLSGTWKRMRKGLLHQKTLAVILSICTIFSSSIVLSGEIRSFDLPSVYSQPYEDLSEEDGNFRVLNLPYAQVYYDPENTRLDGYPSTQTPEVGMYSPYISGKMYAFGLETKDYWYFVGSALFGENFGYKEMSQLLGGTADVRFIVSQAQTDINEKNLFASLEGMVVWNDYGSAVIFENELWEGRVHAADSSLMVVGSRQYLVCLAGMDVTDLSDVNVMLSYGSEELDSIRNIAFSSLLEYTIETSLDTIKLSSLGNSHTQDASKWIYYDSFYLDGYSPYPGVYTNGRDALSFNINASSSGEYTLLLDLMQMPNAGILAVEIDGYEVSRIDCRSTYVHSAWSEVSLYLSEGKHTVSLVPKGPGSVCAIQASLVLSSDLEYAMSSSMEEMNSSVAIPAFLSSMWQGTYLPWYGEEGFGLGDTTTYYALEDGKQAVLTDGNYTMGKIPKATASTEYNISLDVYGENHAAVAVEIWLDGYKQPAQIQTFSDLQNINFTYESSGDPFSVVVRSIGYDKIFLNSMTVSVDSADASTVLYAASDGEYLLRIAGDATAYLDGEEIALTPNGIYLEAYVNLSKGDHELHLTDANIYGAALIRNEEQETSNPIVSYIHNNNISYEIHTSSEEGFWLMVCDSYSPKWVASINGEELIHTSANSMVNAYYVPAGEYDISIEYKGQDTYNTMLLVYAASVIAGIVVTLVLVWILDRRHNH